MIKARVHSNYPQIAAKLKKLPAKMRPVVSDAFRGGLLLVISESQKHYLSGPRPLRLGVVTTRLRNSLAARVRDDAKKIVGQVGSNVRYAAWHEFGYRGAVHVRAHTRIRGILARGKRFSLRTARRPIYELSSGEVVGYRRSSKRALSRARDIDAVLVSFVRAHTRMINYRGRPFLRPAIISQERRIAARVLRALRCALKRDTERQS